MAQELKPELDQLIDRTLEYKIGDYEKFDDALPGEMDGFTGVLNEKIFKIDLLLALTIA